MKPMKIRSFFFLIILLVSTPSMASANPILVSFGAVSALVGATSSFVAGLVALQLSFSPLVTLLTATGTAIVSGAGAFSWMIYKLREH